MTGPCDEDSDCAGSIGCGIGGTCGSQQALCSVNTDCDTSSGLSCILGSCHPPSYAGGACDPHDADDCQLNLDCGEGSGGVGSCGGPDAGTNSELRGGCAKELIFLFN